MSAHRLRRLPRRGTHVAAVALVLVNAVSAQERIRRAPPQPAGVIQVEAESLVATAQNAYRARSSEPGTLQGPATDQGDDGARWQSGARLLRELAMGFYCDDGKCIPALK